MIILQRYKQGIEQGILDVFMVSEREQKYVLIIFDKGWDK